MELFDILIFGAIFYWIVQAVRRAAASAQAEKRPPAAAPGEDADRISDRERLRRALASATEWEEEQRRREEAAEIRAEIEALHAEDRARQSPWRSAREEQLHTLERAEREVRDVRLPVSTMMPHGPESLSAGGDAPSLSDALAGVAAMLDQRPGDQVVARREPARSVVQREPATPARRSKPAPPIVRESVEAAEARAFAAKERRASRPAFGELPGLARLTPLQRAVVFAEIINRPVALSGTAGDALLD